MRPDMEKPGALAGATGWVEGNSLPIGTAENGPDTPQAKSTSVGCDASPPLADIAARINEAHDRASASARSTIEAAMEAGHLLIQAKDRGRSWRLAAVAEGEYERERAHGPVLHEAGPRPAQIRSHCGFDPRRGLETVGHPEGRSEATDSTHRSAASPKSSKVEVLPPKPKPPGSSPNLLTDDDLVDRIRSDVEAAERRGIDIANLVLGPPALDPQTSVPPLPMSADPEAEINHRPSAVADGINTITDTEDADTADDTDELDVHYGPLTGREWIALCKRFDMHNPHTDG